MKEKTVYALGVFDGVHLGHQALLKACLQLAKTGGYKAGVVTFTSHPDTLVSGKTPGLINTMEDRAELLRAYGIEEVISLPFDRALMTTHWAAFLTQLVARNAVGFVCGSDFRFGAGGEGTAEKLAEFCEKRQLPYAVVPQLLLGDVRVSSTHIRRLLKQGDVEEAARFLGHPHVLSGQVVAGQKLGRTIGIPTANLELPEQLVQLKFGVYACKTVLDGKEYLAVTNVGIRPTVGGEKVTVEPWILDFDGDLYSKEITLEFYKFLRPEQKFENLDTLQGQIRADAEKTRTFFLEK